MRDENAGRKSDEIREKRPSFPILSDKKTAMGKWRARAHGAAGVGDVRACHTVRKRLMTYVRECALKSKERRRESGSKKEKQAVSYMKSQLRYSMRALLLIMPHSEEEVDDLGVRKCEKRERRWESGSKRRRSKPVRT